MPSLKAIRKRISSVQNTQQITKAMKMVAAAKLRRAQTAALAARPYAAKLEEMVGHLLSRLPEEAHPLLQPPAAGLPTLVILASGDRGLCGGYNVNLGRTSDAFARERQGETRFAVVGRKGIDHLRRRGATIDERYEMPLPSAAADLAHRLAQHAEQLFVAGSIGEVFLIYTQFRSALSQVPVVEQLLPLTHETDPQHPPAAIDYLFEPGPAEIVDHILPRLIEVRILRALLEAGASEQAARMTAMDSATRNASEMINRLTLEMNRARQAAITKELMEIISGAEALKG